MTDVTDEMVEAACVGFNHEWPGKPFKERARLAVEYALAARPQIVGDAVVAVALEAARAAWNTPERVDRWIALSELKEIVLPVIEAADAARGHAMVRWRKPEEWTPRPGIGWESVWIWWLAPGTKLGPRLCSHPVVIDDLPPGTLAWTEQPAPPPWAETAPPVASTQAEAPPDAQATGDAREAPVAEPIWPEGCRNERSCVQHGKCDLAYFGHIVGDNCPHFDRNATPLRFIPPDDEAPVSEPAPVWTREKEELLRRLTIKVTRLLHNSDLYDSASDLRHVEAAAFPDPAPVHTLLFTTKAPPRAPRSMRPLGGLGDERF